MLKGETISQFDGFGNNVQETPLEFFRSSGFSKSMNGITANKYLTNWFSQNISVKYPQYTSFGSVGLWASGFGRDTGTTSGTSSMVYFLDENGILFGSVNGTSTFELLYDFNKNASLLNTGAGMIIDQKKRLLVVGERYLQKFDPSVADVAGNISVTNGSGNLVASGATFTAGMVGKNIRFFVGGTHYIHKIASYTDSTHATITGTIAFATGSYTAVILDSFEIQWKDFGSDKDLNSEENSMYFPMETYEDTVLIGRGSNIVSLNTLTDAITDDATPAFTLPIGFDILAIHKGLNGILIGCNFQRKGVLILWDNFSDRSIAPWIELPDRLVSLCKYGGGWIAITSREIYYTDGYSLTTLKKFFLDSNKTVFTASVVPQTSFVTEDRLSFIGGYTDSGKRRAGLYQMDLTSKLFEFYPRQNLDQYNEQIKSIYYDAGNGNGRLFAGTSSLGIDYLMTDSEPPVATFISNPIGQGENWKYAEGLKLNLGVSPQNSVKQSPYSFKVVAKICPMEKQMFNVGVVKTTMADTTHVVVNESTYHIASVGDEIEFLDGESAGYSRNIIAITGSGTATATYTLDRAVPTVVSANYHFFITPFRLIKVKTYTNVSAMPIVEFEIKNRPKGKKFLIKIEIEDANVPVELRPSVFLYDDTGTI